MIRVRVPAGITTSKQWLQMDEITDKYGISTLKLSTRQAYELHGVIKRNLKTTMQEINNAMHDTIAACGDVVRNVMSSANPHESEVHTEVSNIADAISLHFMPRTNAYHEIWLDKQKITTEETEPIYGSVYLPRKFKISIAIPPINDTDVFAHDIGLIAIIENNTLVGFNVAVGGGMGMSFGMPETYPRLATILGFAPKQNVIDVCEKIVTIQRDFGNRENRKQARLKYTFDTMGEEAFRKELFKRLGYEIEQAKEYNFSTSGDQFGWKQGSNGKWNYTLFVEGGRVKGCA
jgi:sulfite reductase (NADPH) hemoprotein beta-component